MFTPVPNACGSVLITVQMLDNVITVDPGLYQRLEDALGIMGSNHTYLKVGTYPYIEYIRVTSVSGIPNQIVVERAIDNTLPQIHAANTAIEYVLAAQAVQDMVDAASMATLSLTGQYPVIVDQSAANAFGISLAPVSLTSENGSIIISGTFPEMGIVVNPTNNGCCG